MWPKKIWLKFETSNILKKWIYFIISFGVLFSNLLSYLFKSTWTKVPVSKKHLNMYLCMFLGSENQWHCKTDVY